MYYISETSILDFGKWLVGQCHEFYDCPRKGFGLFIADTSERLQRLLAFDWLCVFTIALVLHLHCTGFCNWACSAGWWCFKSVIKFMLRPFVVVPLQLYLYLKDVANCEVCLFFNHSKELPHWGHVLACVAICPAVHATWMCVSLTCPYLRLAH